MANAGNKHCPKCNTTKPITEFRQRNDRAARRYKCIECDREANRRYSQNRDREARRAYAREYYHRWKLTDAGRYARTRSLRVKRLYGLSDERFQELLSQQKGRCAICTKPPGQKGLHVDHCHETGKVRGLLCHRCNLALGLFGDTAEQLERALTYLRE